MKEVNSEWLPFSTLELQFNTNLTVSINAGSKGYAIYIFKQLSPSLKTGYFYC